MEPYNLQEFTEKINKSLRVLTFLWEVKGNKSIRPTIVNVNPHLWDKGALVYFELEFKLMCEDPDVGSFNHTLNDFDDEVNRFFRNVVLQPNAEFKYVSKRDPDHDDMIGLFTGVKYNWDGHESSYNMVVQYGFEYNLYYDEYDQYHGS